MNTDTTYFMEKALELARVAGSLGEVPVGAVLVLDGEIIGQGYNQPIQTHDPSAHAEIVALRDAGRQIGNYRLPQAELYVTLEPCVMCFGAICHARLRKVIFGATDPKTGVAGGRMDLFSHEINHHTQVEGGLLALASSQLLRSFFAARRSNTLIT